MARRRRQRTPSVDLVPTTNLAVGPGFSLEPLIEIEVTPEIVSICKYKDAQLKLLRDAYITSLGVEVEEERIKRSWLAHLIEITQTTYRNIPDTENMTHRHELIAYNNLVNRAIWFNSLESGLRKSLYELIRSETGYVDFRPNIRASLVEELQSVRNLYDVTIDSLFTEIEELLASRVPVEDFAPQLDDPYDVNMLIRRLSYVWTTPDYYGSPTNLEVPQESESLTIGRVSEVIQEVFSSFMNNLTTEGHAQSRAAEPELQNDRSNPNRWHIITGPNGIEGVVLNGRRLNVQALTMTTEPGSLTRLNLEVLISPASDILSFTSSPRPSYSDGGLRNAVATPTGSTEAPSAPTPAPATRPVRRLDI